MGFAWVIIGGPVEGVGMGDQGSVVKPVRVYVDGLVDDQKAYQQGEKKGC